MLCGDINGKEIQKRELYVYVCLIHFAVLQTLTQQWKATILQLKKNNFCLRNRKVMSVTNKMIFSCMTTRAANIAWNIISTRTVFHRASGRGGGAFRSTCLASLNLLLGLAQLPCFALSTASGAEQIGGVTYYRQVSLCEHLTRAPWKPAICR